MSQPSLLIVSAAAGAGHVRAGDALKKAAELEHSDWHVEHIEILSLAPRWVNVAYGGGFELIAARAPRLWRGMYWLADGPTPDHARWAGIARRMLFRSFERVLLKRNWNHVLTTHFLPAQLVAGARAGMPRMSMVITDFELHRYWVQPHVPQYSVASPALASALMERIPAAEVSVTGIPIDPSLGEAGLASDARQKLGMDPARPVVLVLGGGLGIGVGAAARTLLEHAPAHVQILVVCGRNQDAFEQLRGLDVSPERLKCCGFVDNMARVYAAADVVVTKPGGLSCSEALALGKPMLLTQPIPGHEEGNLKWLTEAGAALPGTDRTQLTAVLQRIFTEPELLTDLSAAARRIGRPDASRAVLHSIESSMRAKVAA